MHFRHFRHCWFGHKSICRKVEDLNALYTQTICRDLFLNFMSFWSRFPHTLFTLESTNRVPHIWIFTLGPTNSTYIIFVVYCCTFRKIFIQENFWKFELLKIFCKNIIFRFYYSFLYELLFIYFFYISI